MPTDDETASYLGEAIDLAVDNVESGLGGPFGALIVEDDTVLARGTNRVTTVQDPTAHAEITAIRAACKTRGDFRLNGCTLYSSCEPCPMCMGAIYWARLDRVVYAASHADAATVGFDDSHIYEELHKAPADRDLPMEQHEIDGAQRPFTTWKNNDDRTEY